MNRDEIRERDDALVAFHDGGKRTLQEVGMHFRLTRERVRQILSKRAVQERRGNIYDTPHQERLDRYRSALRPGVKAMDAAAEAGLTYSDAQNSASALGLKLPRPVSLAKLKRQEVAAYYAAHPDLTGSAVADHFGVSPQFVSRALAEAGVASRWFVANRPTSPDPRP